MLQERGVGISNHLISYARRYRRSGTEPGFAENYSQADESVGGGDAEALRANEGGHGVLEVANLYGRYGYRTVFDLLSAAGRQTGEAVVRRIWGEEGLRVPAKQPPQGRLWLHP